MARGQGMVSCQLLTMINLYQLITITVTVNISISMHYPDLTVFFFLEGPYILEPDIYSYEL